MAVVVVASLVGFEETNGDGLRRTVRGSYSDFAKTEAKSKACITKQIVDMIDLID